MFKTHKMNIRNELMVRVLQFSKTDLDVNKPFRVESGYYILSLSDRESNPSKFSGLNLKINSINQCFAKGFLSA